MVEARQPDLVLISLEASWACHAPLEPFHLFILSSLLLLLGMKSVSKVLFLLLRSFYDSFFIFRALIDTG